MRKHAIKSKIYIFCNGEKAEPIYFQDLKDDLGSHGSHVIKIKYKAFKKLSPWDLINKAIVVKNNYQNKEKFSDEDGDQCWCVFDVDEYWNQNSQKFKIAIKNARANNINLAWSNECFELWYLLHFQVLQVGISRKDYIVKLRKHLRKLDKRGKGMYNSIENT